MSAPIKKVIPLLDRLVIKPFLSSQTTEKGIMLPTPDKKHVERVAQGLVVAVGPGKRAEDSDAFIPSCLKSGDVVLYHNWGGDKVQLKDADEDTELQVIKESQVLAKLEVE